MKLRDLPIYVIHYKPNTERKKHLSSWFEQHNLSVTWVEDAQRETLTEELISKFYRFNPQIYGRKLNLSEIGCTIAHIFAYQDIISKNHDYAIVLEDDAVFCENFIENFDRLFESVPEDCDMVSLGSCCDLTIKVSDAQKANSENSYGIYKKIPFQTRCSFALLLSKKSCEVFVENSTPFSWPIDWQWLEIQGFTGRPPSSKNRLTIYWTEPSLIRQGSELGTYESSMRVLDKDGRIQEWK